MVRAIELEELPGALDPGPRSLTSIVGGGGKTTTLFTLGAHLDATVVMTTTTKMGSERDDGHAVLLDPSDADLRDALVERQRVLVWSARGPHRAEGVTAAACDRWFGASLADHVVVEADGSRGRPFKAPYPYEPVIPAASSLVIACLGAGALGRPIGAVCHRVDAVTSLLGVEADATLTPARAAQVLLSESGSRKSVPTHARFVVIAHQVRAADLEAVGALDESLGDVPLIAVALREGLPARP